MLWAFFALAAMIDWWSVATNRPAVEQWFKPLVLVMLMAVAAASSFDSNAVKLLLLTGLAFGLVGDVLLLRAINRFRAGLVAFLIGHLAYIAALATAEPASPTWLIGGAVVTVAMLAAARLPALVAGVRTQRPTLLGPVLVYTAVIATMVWLAVGSGRPLTMIGACLFAASDRLLAEDRFVRPIPETRWLVHLTYHLGQAALIAGLMTSTVSLLN